MNPESATRVLMIDDDENDAILVRHMVGKVRDRVEIAVGLSEAQVEALVLARPKVMAALGGAVPDRIIHAGGGRLVNIVVRG